jgi:putative MATE family efflux protein
MNIKKYIGSKAFYKSVLFVALPIMLQNLITNFVNLIDNLMVGSLGTEEVAAVAIVNQLVFIYNLTVFGAISGAGIFSTQYFGKNNHEGIRYTLRFKTIICSVITALSFLIFIVFGDKIIASYLSDGSYNCDLDKAFYLAKKYLGIIMIGFVPYSLTQIYAGTLKESGETFVPMVAGFAAVIINTVINYLLIFGIAFFPRMSVSGAAIGTTVSRFLECIIVICYITKTKKSHSYFEGALKSLYIPKKELKSFVVKGVPLLINECMWSVGMSLLTLAYSSYGLAVVAGQSISATLLNLFNITFRSLGIAVGIIAGKRLGAGEFEEAVDEARKLNAFSVFVSIIIAIITLLCADYITLLYNVSDESKELAVFFIKASAIFMPFLSYENSAYCTLRSGGKVLATILFDGCVVFFLCVPVAFGFAAFTSVYVTYIAVQCVDILKAVFGAILVKKRVWVCSIVE